MNAPVTVSKSPVTGGYCWGTGKDGSKMYMINVRCLEGVEHDTLEFKKVDGKSF